MKSRENGYNKPFDNLQIGRFRMDYGMIGAVALVLLPIVLIRMQIDSLYSGMMLLGVVAPFGQVVLFVLTVTPIVWPMVFLWGVLGLGQVAYYFQNNDLKPRVVSSFFLTNSAVALVCWAFLPEATQQFLYARLILMGWVIIYALFIFGDIKNRK